MIVKNEAHGVRDTLTSFAPFIDRWSILDTGSTDGTQAIIRDTLGKIPGELFEEPFVDFATSRNRALDLHGTSTRFTIMPDSDDRLVEGATLRSFLVDHQADEAAAYTINLRRGSLSYYLPLVLRTATGWRYHGAVHEYVGPVNGEGYATVQVPGAQLAQDYKAKSVDASRKRWERDLGILRAELKAKPDDARALFYLAQTYECLGEPEHALITYERRIAVGGWDEETYEARYRRAKIMQTLGRSWDAIERAFMDAFEFDSRRAEPLFKIAEHWYCTQDHSRAYLYASRAADLARPTATLFVDEDVYAWKAADIVAISGFYVGDPASKVNGRRSAEKCVRARPTDERVRANWAFYALPAAEMFTDYSQRPIDITTVDPWSPYNPSVHYEPGTTATRGAKNRGRWRCVVRTSNYKIINGNYLTPDNNIIYTRNFLLELDDDLSTKRSVEMIDKTEIPRSAYPCHGFEDCRLFRHGGKLCFTSTVCDFDLDRAWEGPREIVLGELNADYAIVRATPLRGPWTARAQKNWMPIADTGRFLYATSPDGGKQATVLELDGNVVKPIADGTRLDHGRLRGGSQLVRTPHGWLAIVHDVAWPGGNGRIYLHRFVMLDDGFQITGMTDPFYFEHRGVEFCAGLAYDGKRLVASFGVDDQRARFGIFTLESVIARLRTDYQI
jgi:tetratricopeptide (TPR) repeat protein